MTTTQHPHDTDADDEFDVFGNRVEFGPYPTATALISHCDYGIYCRELPQWIVTAQPTHAGMIGEDRPLCTRHAWTIYAGPVTARVIAVRP